MPWKSKSMSRIHVAIIQSALPLSLPMYVFYIFIKKIPRHLGLYELYHLVLFCRIPIFIYFLWGAKVWKPNVFS